MCKIQEIQGHRGLNQGYKKPLKPAMCQSWSSCKEAQSGCWVKMGMGSPRCSGDSRILETPGSSNVCRGKLQAWNSLSSRERPCCSGNKAGGAEWPTDVGVQMISSWVPDARLRAVGFGVCPTSFWYCSDPYLPLFCLHSSILEWECLVCASVYLPYVT